LTETEIPRYDNGPDPNKSHFAVKVQRLVDNSSYLAINNKDMTISGLLLESRNADLFTGLKQQIEAEGIYGNMAFFQATWDSENGLKVNPCVVLPPEIW
jgi:hypothetical protein